MLITNFSAGELSPNLYGRVDLQQYYQGAAKLNNFDVIPTGGIKRRTGFKRIAELRSDCKLIPFIINKNESYIIVIGYENHKSYMQIWKDGVLTATKEDLTYGSIREIKELQYAQNYDTLILVHKNYRPVEIKKTASSWTFTEIDFDFSPVVNLDDDYGMVMEVYGTEMPFRTKPGVQKFIYRKYNPSKTEKWEYAQVNYPDGSDAYCIIESKLYRISPSDDTWSLNSEDPDIDKTLFTDSSGLKYPSAVSFFNNRLWLASTVGSPQKVWASCTPDTKDNRYYKFSTYQKYVTINRTIKDPDAHVFTCDLLVDHDESGEAVETSTTTLSNVTQDFTKDGILKNDVTDYYVSGEHIPIGTKVVSVTENSITIDTAITITEDIKAMTCTIQLWKDYELSDAEDYIYTAVETNVVTSDCSFNFELASRENDAIKWLCANRYLTIGTESTVWCCPNTITALSIMVENAGHYGSEGIQAIGVDRAVVFFAQGGYGIREQYFDTQTEGFTTNNIALHADHLLHESPAVDFDYMNNPYNRLVIVREDGKVIQLLYDKNNGVLAWYRFTHGKASVKNCAIVRGDRQNDVSYFSVLDNGKYFLESYDDNNTVYLDSWEAYNPSLDTGEENPYSVYGPDAKLYNETIDELCDHDNIPDDFLHDGDRVYIGYLYESDIISLPVQAGDPSNKKRIVNLTVRFLDSWLPIVRVADLPEEKFSQVTSEPYSGQQEVTYPGQSNEDVTFHLHTDKPHAVNILSVNALLV